MTIHFLMFTVDIKVNKSNHRGRNGKTQDDMKEQLLNRKAAYRYLY
ncbi:hypothetical protein [Halobacillus sp. Marseille-Q1614]|nr:hypothetical protein [Halobacillus sp. Marseille-Q1614]